MSLPKRGETLADSTSTVDVVVEPERELAPGTLVVDRYRIVSVLGRGAQSVVYDALDSKRGRTVALKVLSRYASSDSVVAGRFRREIAILRTLDDPRVVPIHDSGTTSDGCLFLTMDRLEGETLRARLRRSKSLPIADAIELAIDVLSSLAAAHRHGIVHRDVKPANVFLRKQEVGQREVVTLLDFGLAKDVAATSEDDLTATGQVCGTPAYMSPEQIQGHPVDARTDLYAVGVLLYEALTGTRPFEPAGFSEALFAHVYTAPEPVERRMAGIPAALSAIVMRALQKGAGERFSSAEEMAAALRALSGRASRARRSLVPLAIRSAVVATFVLALVMALRFPAVANARFAGFALGTSMHVSPVIDTRWSGIQAGLRGFDQLLSIDNVLVPDAATFTRIISGAPEGTTFSVRVLRDGRQLVFQATVSRLGWGDLLRHYGTLFLNGILFLLVGGYVAWRHPNQAAARALFYFSTAFGALLVLAIDCDHTHSMMGLWNLAFSCVGSTLAHVGLVSPEPPQLLRRRPALIALVYLPAVALFVVWTVASYTRNLAVVAGSFRTAPVLFVIGLASVITLLLFARRRAPTLRHRQAATFLGRAVAAAFSPLLVLGALPVVLGLAEWVDAQSWAVWWFCFLWTLILPLSVAWLTVRRDVFDLNSALGGFVIHTIRVAVLFSILLTTRALLSWLFDTIGSSTDSARRLSSLLAFSLVAIVWRPITIGFVRLRSFGAKTNRDEMIRAYSDRLTTHEDEAGILASLEERLRLEFRPGELRIVAREGDSYHVHEDATRRRTATMADVRLDPDSADERVRDRQVPLTSAALTPLVTNVAKWRAYPVLLLPLRPDYFVALGARRDGRSYSSRDADMITTLIQLAGVRLVSIRDYATRERARVARHAAGPGARPSEGPLARVPLDGTLARTAAAVGHLRIDGFSRWASTRDAGEVQATLARIQDRLARDVFAQDGIVVAESPEQLLFAFPSSRATRADARRRAMATAEAHLHSLRELGKELELPLAGAVGVAEGEVLCGLTASSLVLVGDPVVRARDLALAAKADELAT